MKRIFLGLIITVLSLVFLAACANEEERRVDEYRWVMDTRIVVSVFYMDDDRGRLEQQHRDIASEAADLTYMFDALWDRFVPGSDIYRINHAGGEYVEVDQHTINILQYALYFREMTGGRFDVTIGAVMDLWDFGFFNEALLPDSGDIARALATVGADIIISGNRVRLSNPDTRLDLGAIAKGYAADYIGEFLRGHGVAGIVNLQGDTMFVGDRPTGELWSMGVSDPLSGEVFGPDIFALFVPADTAVVTSGTTARGFITQGHRFHHIMDVDTGWPVETIFTSVTVVAPTAILGEALTSAVYTMHEPYLSALLSSLEGVHVVSVDEWRGVWHSPGIGPVGEPGTVIPIAGNPDVMN